MATPAVLGIVGADARAIARDSVALGSVALSVLGVLVVTVLGAYQRQLPGWSSWFPFMVAVSLVGGPGGFGLLFGLLMVDEADTGVRDALMVTPVPPALFMSVRTVLCTSWMAVWPLASIWVMNSTWKAVHLPVPGWAAVVAPVALLTPVFALTIPTLADDKVAALAVFKVLSFASLIPLALFFVPADAWYRWPLLVLPTAWTVESLRAFLDGAPGVGYAASAGGALYAGALLAGAIQGFRRKVYRLRR